MSREWLLKGALFFLIAGFLPGCGEEVSEEAAVKLPPMEHTWVKNETVRKSKEDFFSKEEAARPEIAVNEELAKRLTQAKSGKTPGSVADADSCLALLEPLDRKRMAVQKAGGVWHAFERSPEARPFSDRGMQIDSRINETTAAVRRLCKTAKGIPLDNIARVISRNVAEKGKEVVREELIRLGKAEADIKIWLEHAEYSKKNEKRDMDYKTIETLILQTETLMDFYEDLARREVDETTKQAFVSDAVTFLQVLDDRLSTNEYLSLALKEDKNTPYENIQVDL